MATWKKVITSGSAAVLSSAVLDTDLAVAHGGTGASTEAAARTSLGVGPIAGNTSLVEVGTIGTGTWQGTAVANAYVAQDLTIAGGTVNSSVIGGSTPAAGTFTALGATGNIESTAANGKISGSSTSTGSFGLLKGDGSGITNLSSAAINAFTNGSTANRIVTSVNSTSVDAEQYLTFDGTILENSAALGKISGSSTSTGSFGLLQGDGSELTGVTQDIDNLTELAATPHASQDEFLISDNGVEKRISMTNVANGAFALTGGDVAIAAGGTATIQADSVESSMIDFDYVQNITGGVGIDSTGNTSGEGVAHSLSLDLNELTNKVTIVDADFISIVDSADSNASKKITFENLEDAVFASVSGDVTITEGGVAAIGSTKVTDAMLNADVATGLAGAGLNVPSANELGVNVGHGIEIDSDAVRVKLHGDTLTRSADGMKVSSGNITATEIAGAVAGVGLSGGDGAALAVNFAELAAAEPSFANLTVTGDLTVQGTSTILETQNLLVEDNFIFAGTGSAGKSWDGGLIVQSGSADKSGSALYSDNTGAHRWAVAKGVQASGSNTVTPEAFVTTVQIQQVNNPSADSGSYGEGEMYITAADDIWIRTG